MTNNFTDSAKFKITVGDIDYIAEFDVDSLEETVKRGALDESQNLIFTTIPLILYGSLKKNQPNITPSAAAQLWTDMRNEGYTVTDFTQTIGSEFNRLVGERFFGSTETKKKIVKM